MAVLLTVSETISGSAIADALAGAGTGVDMGAVVNNEYSNVISKAANTGAQSLFVRHDAAVDEITAVKVFFQTYGVGTGFTYGGADSAANDFTTLRTMANGSGDSKNNGDGLSAGFWVDMNHKVTTANQFDYATNGNSATDGSEGGDDTVYKFGDANADMIDLATAQTLDAQAMSTTADQSLGGDATNGFTPTAPVAGSIGKASDNALGERATLKFRLFIANAFTQGGIIQWELVIAYSFTA